MMKFVIRAFALTLVLAGATAVSLSSGTTNSAAVSNHLSATSKLPVPMCYPDPCPVNVVGEAVR